jgi:hypothetical protein
MTTAPAVRVQVNDVQEENGWKDAAGTAGIHLMGVELEDMKALYPLLMRNVSDPAEKTRLRAYIQRLQSQAQQPPPPQDGELRRVLVFCIQMLLRIQKWLRCCSRIKCFWLPSHRFNCYT